MCVCVCVCSGVDGFLRALERRWIAMVDSKAMVNLVRQLSHSRTRMLFFDSCGFMIKTKHQKRWLRWFNPKQW